MTIEPLRARSPVALPPAVWADLDRAYTGPGRHYHTLEHLAELADWVDAVAAGPGWRDLEAVWLALLFHDAVYDALAPKGQNEEHSARLLLEAVPAADTAARLVRATATHGAGGDAADPDEAHFLDADVAILGAEPARFARYEAQIEAEYAPRVGLAAYRAGRRVFLASMAGAAALFRTPFFGERLEARARANLARALAGPP